MDARFDTMRTIVSLLVLTTTRNLGSFTLRTLGTDPKAAAMPADAWRKPSCTHEQAWRPEPLAI